MGRHETATPHQWCCTHGKEEARSSHCETRLQALQEMEEKAWVERMGVAVAE